MITAILLGFLGLFLGMVGLRCTNIGGLELSRKTKLAATAGALHILAGNRGKSWVDPALQWEGMVLQRGWGGQPRPQGCLTFPFALTPDPSPCSPTLTHTRQIPWLQISPSAMFLEPALGARHERGVGGTPKVRVSALQSLQSGWEDQS